MEDAKLKWDNQLARQSKTLEQAVETYKTRYGRSPPRGFDDWWKFARANDVQIVDNYDQIHTSITPFLALDPVFLGSRLSQLLTKEGFSYELQVRRDELVNITGERIKSNRALEMSKLLDGFRQFLPADFGEGLGSLGEVGGDDGLVKLSVSDHDLGSRIMGEEFRNRMMGLAERGAHIDQEQLKVMEDTSRKGAMADGLLKACSWRSLSDRKPFKEAAIFSERDDFSEKPNVLPISFIKNPTKSFDFCHNPSIVPYHASYARNVVRTPKLHPQFVLSKIAQSPQILMAPMVAFQNKTSGVTSWEEKTNNKVFWRGSTTGGHHEKKNDFNWRNSHRVRLNALANAHGDSHTDVLVETGYDEDTREVSMRRLHARELNEHMFDVGITAVSQCQESDGTCDEMRDEIKLGGYVTPKETLLYRYALDIDGNGWSSRFRRLVALGQVVFKITIYPEWNTEWLTPWLHYVPVNLDLTDLYHTSTFFIGVPGVSEGNEAIGKVISSRRIGAGSICKHTCSDSSSNIGERWLTTETPCPWEASCSFSDPSFTHTHTHTRSLSLSLFRRRRMTTLFLRPLSFFLVPFVLLPSGIWHYPYLSIFASLHYVHPALGFLLSRLAQLQYSSRSFLPPFVCFHWIWFSCCLEGCFISLIDLFIYLLVLLCVAGRRDLREVGEKIEGASRRVGSTFDASWF